MKLNKDYRHFKQWFKEMEISFYQGQYDDEQIAYSAFKEGMKHAKPMIGQDLDIIQKTAKRMISDKPKTLRK